MMKSVANQQSSFAHKRLKVSLAKRESVYLANTSTQFMRIRTRKYRVPITQKINAIIKVNEIGSFFFICCFKQTECNLLSTISIYRLRIKALISQ